MTARQQKKHIFPARQPKKIPNEILQGKQEVFSFVVNVICN